MPSPRSLSITVCCAAAFHLASAVPCFGETGDVALESGFMNPPDSARPWVWAHWLHGNVDKACITRELEAIKRVGLGGVTMFDVAQPGIPAGPNRYMDSNWRGMFAWEISEAKRTGLEVMSHIGPGYSGSGGPWITPEYASQKIVESSVRAPGGSRFSGKLPQPRSEGGFYRDVAVIAVRETESRVKFRIDDFDMKRLVWLNYIRWKGTSSAPPGSMAPADACIPLANSVDLTRLMKGDGTIEWDAPAGAWTILRFGHTWTGQKTLPATPDGEGPECDKLDKRGIRRHFEQVMKRMVDLAGPEAGRTFHTFFVDSWEAGGQNWTENMPAEFRRRRGYDIMPFLPVLSGRVMGDLQTSERFLYDLRQTVSELVTENFWAEMQRLCHSRGMRLAVQPYITTGNDFDAGNFTDEPMGEFWSHPFQPNDYRTTIKAAVSSANLNGRVIVGAEAFTASEQERWLAHPATLKSIGDRAFCLGANRFQIHRLAMQRFPQIQPGMAMGKWGQHYDTTQTWWEWSKPWHDYLARCQFMLRQGPVVTDVLALAPEEPLSRFEYQPIPGYDCDVCGPDTFKRIAVRDGVVGIPDGPQYQIITVEHQGTMTLARLRKLRDLVVAGACLLGEPPVMTPGLEGLPEADVELKSLAGEIWGSGGESDRRVGKGRVFRDIPPAEALKRLGVVPDFTGPAGLTWIHRRAGDAEIYFISSASDRSTAAACTFRVTGKQAELWNPETGSIRRLACAAADASRTMVSVPLGPDGSAFVVFRSAVAGEVSIPERQPEELGISVPVSGPWTLGFPEGSGAPRSLVLDSPVSWSASVDPAVRHFSGTAVYQTYFDFTGAGAPVILDLGRVGVMARVSLNGSDLGILWKPPYQVDVTDFLKQGRNRLEIAVVNLWVNRMIGDAGLAGDSPGDRDKSGVITKWPQWVLDGKAAPNGRRTFVTFPLWKANEALQESGLIGPVVLKYPGKGRVE